MAGIVPENEVQLDFSTPVEDLDKQRRIMQALDAVRSKYGYGSIFVGTQGTSNRWKLRQERLSRCFTTRWEEVLEVKM